MSLPRVESTYVTDECLREWKSGNPSFRVSNPVPTLRFLYELCSAMVRGELPYQKCKAAVDSVEFLDRVSDEDLGSHFADIIAQMAQDITMPGENRSRLIKLAKWFTESALVPVRLFQERCEEEFLWDSEMIKIKAQDLKSKVVRVNTRLLYQQTKFNLLREESEGYAKLVTLLCRDIGSSNHSASPSIIGIIKSLIGHFDLDPNRVFDIVLECFELQPDNNVFLDLIPIFPKSHASQILGFKFQYYQRIEVNRPMPFGLYQLTALLVKEEFIDLDSIYAHLLPKDDEAFEHYNAFSMKQLDEANKIGKINLAATGKDLMDDEKQADITIDLFSALDMETEAAFERSSELENNQSLGLLLGFLSVDDWYHAHKLLDRLLPLNPVEHIQICNGLFRLIETSLTSVFDVAQQMHLEHVRLPSGAGLDSMEASTSAYRSLVDLPIELFEMLTAVGPYLFRNALLLQKVCRVLRAYYSSALELFNRGSAVSNIDSGVIRNRNPRLHLKEAGARIEETLGACLLPSLQLIPANPAVGQEIWEIMNLLPYEVRYRLYGEWEKDDERNPMVLAARQTAKLDTRRTLKRLAKENLKQLGRMVAKLAHSNPMTVLRTIVHQIEAYREMIAPVVDAFKYLTQLEYDVLEYVVIERLAQGGREKLKDDGVNLSDWLQSLASFWGHLCKKYPSMELRGLFQYLVNQLKKGNGIELVLLQELIQQMANVQYTENMTEEQLDAMAGSETLRYQATSFGITRNNKALIKSTNRLRDSLLPKEEPKLAIPLLLLIAQHRSLVVVNADAPYIKMVSEMFDRCHGALLQYVEFLCNAVVPATAYAQLIPSLDDLVHQYHLEPEVAFLIYRPVMRLFKCEGADIFWPLNDDKSTTTPSVEKDSVSVEFSRNMFLDVGSSGEPIMWSQLLDTVRSMLPSKAWNSLSPDLYATFWGLALYDLHVPKDRYAFEISKLHAALKALEELSDNSNSAITKRKKEKERIQESLDRLSSDFQKHEEHVASVRRRLACEKDKWLSSCPDTLKINMEFLQRCIFPRCTFSMPDAVYCAEFVHALHSLQTPFFNTVNHIDVLICKTLQPMLCCCTEYEAGRLGKFLYKTLKLAYKWKNDESLYNSECGNMPGFAVYYRYPNSQRVTYSQFIKVHWKWSSRITRLLIQCLESTESMEIRNALILLTKISKVFPVTRKSGINLEKRVAKIKSDEREDLKVLATGVAAAMAKRKVKWVTEEEFGKGYLELKPAPTVASKALTNNAVAQNNNTGLNISQSEPPGGQVVTGSQHFDSGNSFKDLRSKPLDGRLERTESVSVKSDLVNVKLKGGSLVNGSDIQSSLAPATLQSGSLRSIDSSKQIDESTNKPIDENVSKVSSKASADSETRPPVKRSVPSASHAKLAKQELLKDDIKSGKTSSRASGFAVDRDMLSHPLEVRQSAATNSSSAVTMNGSTGSILIKGSSRASLDTHGSETKAESGAPRSSTTKDDGTEDIPRPSSSRTGHSPRLDNSAAALKIIDKQQKRSSPSEEPDKLNKRRKGDTDVRDLDADVRFLERDRSLDPKFDRHNPADGERSGNEELRISKATDKPLDRSKDKVNERYDRDYRERVERSDKSRGDDLAEKARDRSIERHGRERSIEKTQERGVDRSFDRLTDRAKDERNKDDRSKLRYGETEKFHNDDRFLGQSLPPPPPLPPNVVPQSVAGRRDEDSDRRFGTARHSQRLSPRHEEKERRRSEETSVLQDEVKRRRDDDIRDRKREEREALPVKAEERERDRDREKANPLKDDVDASTASKRRKLKREHLPSVESGEFTAAPTPTLTTQSYDGRERGDRKGALAQRAGYSDEPGSRIHSKEVPSKMARHETDPLYDREWDEDKRSQRVELKRRHRK